MNEFSILKVNVRPFTLTKIYNTNSEYDFVLFTPHVTLTLKHGRIYLAMTILLFVSKEGVIYHNNSRLFMSGVQNVYIYVYSYKTIMK